MVYSSRVWSIYGCGDLKLSLIYTADGTHSTSIYGLIKYLPAPVVWCLPFRERGKRDVLYLLQIVYVFMSTTIYNRILKYIHTIGIAKSEDWKIWGGEWIYIVRGDWYGVGASNIKRCDVRFIFKEKIKVCDVCNNSYTISSFEFVINFSTILLIFISRYTEQIMMTSRLAQIDDGIFVLKTNGKRLTFTTCYLANHWTYESALPTTPTSSRRIPLRAS